MNALRVQGMIFSAAAVLATAATATFGRFDEGTELVVLAVLIIVIGVPHGALDTTFARRLYDLRTARGWIGFALAYLALGALVVGVWRLAPILFITGFLVISAAHFSGDPPAGTPVLCRILYGGAIIILPTLLHAQEVMRLFSLLVGADAAGPVVRCLRLLAWPWLTGIAIAAVCRAGPGWQNGLETASVGLLAVVAPPLVAFTVFFCGMHSVRHILRTIDYSGQTLARVLLAGAGPMLAVLVMSAASWHRFHDIPLDTRVIQLVFVGLAALTVPHMALVERVRLSGWARPPYSRP